MKVLQLRPLSYRQGSVDWCVLLKTNQPGGIAVRDLENVDDGSMEALVLGQ